MSTTSADPAPDPDLARARAGDDEAFARLVAPLRRELHAHCYRMLGSVHDADDALQDALLRAWRAIDRFEDRSGRPGALRSWLYTVATNTSLDTAGRRGRRALPMDLGPASEGVVDDPPRTEVAWLGPYPDDPDATVQERETVELAFVAALQHLPGNQRAALLLMEVLGFSAAEVAAMMATTTASVNSAVQRARATLATKVTGPSQQRTLRALSDASLAATVARYTAALEAGDAEALVALLTADVTWTMPPNAAWFRGLPAVRAFLEAAPLRTAWRHVPTRANGQLAVGCYTWDGEEQLWRGMVLDVLTLAEDGRIAEVTAFIGPEHLARAGLPATLPAVTPPTAPG
ncbi:sigma-70 family RNA polymerase sigma factor [Actinomycetospora lutea]|uniref:sigma-70 family RNA polymerase sigma factor n=1 Tax=Actinomycetospora lutea TaxID=663604 RepID=UPI0023652ABC|nr:sigma-70 family RNA polymerase sigma factor [Actinomycetospora lutea]MDD7937733.1 sigma-70 family RNA polymerase sigma factor [Actinomycetospora lutea]